MTDVILLLLVITFYLILAVLLVPFTAHEKGRNPFFWAFIAVVCTPLMAILALAALRDLGNRDEDA
ncbi:MAG: hypothetical protein HY727_01560 [Candidatus Rokubacteria bacterium]|nr:hypothetical protein [Candidatus Rokubacteria bacterium]